MDLLLTWIAENSAPIALAFGGLLVVLLLWWATILLTKLSAKRASRQSRVPASLTLTAQPFMTKDEAAFYNVLRLTVQDDYLLFAQVPLWCLVEINAGPEKVRASFLGRIAFKRVDFVLIHPGTLGVAKVVELEGGDMPAQRQIRNRLVEDTLKAAGIEVVRLSLSRPYTIAELALLLDIEPPE
jgi:Protein of unknown function (DUF2726)